MSSTRSAARGPRRRAWRAIAAVVLGASVLTALAADPAMAANEPTGLALEPGNAQLTATWSAPTLDTGQTLTNYTVEHKAKSASQWTSATTTSTSRTVSTLTNGTVYQVRVRTNYQDAGQSQTSDWASASVTVGAPATPAAPTVVSGNSHLGVTWTAPSGNGTSIFDYDVRYRTVGATDWTVVRDTQKYQDDDLSDDRRSNSTSGMPFDLGDPGTLGVGMVRESVGSNSGFYKVGSNVSAIRVRVGGWNDTHGTPVEARYATSKPTAANLTTHGKRLWWTDAAKHGVGAFVGDAWTPPLPANSYFWVMSIGAGELDFGYVIIEAEQSSTALTRTLTGLRNGASTEVQVRASNTRDHSNWSPSTTLTVGLPDAPPAPVLTAGDGQIGVSWTKPANNGTVITDYDVEYKLSTASTWTDADHAGTARTATLSTLTNGGAYDVRVRAGNSPGKGPWSPTVSMNAGVPSRPAAPTLTKGNGTLTVGWTAPANNGDAINDYNVQYRETGTTTWTAVAHTGAAVTATISTLTNGTSYEVQVQAANTRGAGRWSPSATGRPGAPGKVAAPTLTASGDRQLGVSWTVPTTHGLTVDDYDVQYRKGTSGSWSDWTHTGAATSATITSLLPVTGYQVRVRASSGSATGPWSDPTSGTTQASAPEAPVAPTLAPTLSGGSGSIGVTWTAPTNNGAAVTDYDVRYCNTTTQCDQGSDWTDWAHTGTGLTATITGLTANATYQVQVRATNSEGTGSWSASGTALIGVPSAPAAPTLTASNTSGRLPISWTAPAANGSAIIDYDVRYRQITSNSWARIYDGGGSSSGNVTVVTGSDAADHLTNPIDFGDLGASSSITREQLGSNWGLYKVTKAVDNMDLHLRVDPQGQPSTALTFKLRTHTSKPTGSLYTTGTELKSKTIAANSYGNALFRLWTGPLAKDSYFWVVPERDRTGTGNEIGTREKKVFGVDLRSTTTSYDLTGLTPGVTYVVQVRAGNAVGDGAWSDSAQITLKAGPSAPGTPQLGIGDGQLSVTWTAPSDNGGSAITGYDVWYCSTGCTTDSNWTDASHTGTTASHTIASLTNGTTYQVRVRGVNAIDNGAWATATATVGVPLAPAAPTLRQVNATIEATWAAPTDNGGTITDYDVRYSDDAGATWSEWDSAGTSAATTSTVGGLSIGSAYAVQVRAANGRGESAWSPSASVTLRTVQRPNLAYRPCSAATATLLWAGRGCYLQSGTAGAKTFDSATILGDGATVVEVTTEGYPAGVADVRAYNPLGGSAQIQTSLGGTVQDTFTVDVVRFGIRDSSVSSASTAQNSTFTLTVRLNSPSHLSPQKYAKNGTDLARSWVQLTLPSNSGMTAADHARTGQVSDPIQVVDQYGDTVTFTISTGTPTGAFEIVLQAYRPLPDDNCPLSGDPTQGDLRCYRPPVGSGTRNHLVSGASMSALVMATALAPEPTPTEPPKTQPPVAPWPVTATRTPGVLSVQWLAVDGAESYHVVYTSDDKRSWHRAYTNHVGTTADITGVDDGAEYFVAVQAVNSAGVSNWTDSDRIERLLKGPPAAAKPVTVTRGAGTLTVSWPAVDQAAGYHVVYTSDHKQSWHRAFTNHQGTTAVITDMDDTVGYYVAVQAVNALGPGPWTDSAYVPPDGAWHTSTD